MFPQCRQSYLYPPAPSGITESLSRREATELAISFGVPCRDLPMLVPWNQHLVVGALDHLPRKSVAICRRFLNYMVYIIARSRKSRTFLKFLQRARLVRVGSDRVPGFVRQPADPREKANLLPKQKRPQIPGRSTADSIALTRPRRPPVGIFGSSGSPLTATIFARPSSRAGPPQSPPGPIHRPP